MAQYTRKYLDIPELGRVAVYRSTETNHAFFKKHDSYYSGRIKKGKFIFDNETRALHKLEDKPIKLNERLHLSTGLSTEEHNRRFDLKYGI